MRKPTLILLILLLALGLTAQSFAARNDSPCETVAKLAKKSCRNEVRDDYFNHRANCHYLGDWMEAIECFFEAEAERFEDKALCNARFAARLEVCEMLGEDIYDPDLDPEAFLSAEEIAENPNPYFPLVPGNNWVYENEEELITVTVTHETIEIEEIECIVVRDIVTLIENGELIEVTDDWYAQDLDGNLWYMGEIAKNFEEGRLVDLEGSWLAGEDFAKAGILIQADPYPGYVGRQEFLLREAEDMTEVVSVTADESVDLIACEGQCLETRDFTPVEPGHVEFKYFLPGVGLILEVDPEGEERLELVSYTVAP